VIYGTAESLTIGVGATVIACLGGITLGTAAALAPSLLRRFLIRLIDILLAFLTCAWKTPMSRRNRGMAAPSW